MKLDVFAPNKYKKFLNKRIAQQSVRLNPTVTLVDNGVIAIDGSKRAFGVFDANGKYLTESSQIRGRMAQYIPKYPQNAEYDDSVVIYFGNVYPHFGHFLLEHMNRAWALVDDKYRNAKIVLVNHMGVNPVPKYIMDLVSMMGMEIVVLDKSTRFRQVIVPVQGFCSQYWHYDGFTRAFDYIAEKIPGAGYDKIYVSRAALKMGRTIGEEKIQNVFAKNGFHIVCPETLSLSEQIGLMKDCRVLAGCAGTALHMSLFMPRGGHVIQIKRNRVNKDNSYIQHNINVAKDLDLTVVWASVERVKSEHSSSQPQIIGPTKYLKQFFDVNGFVYDENDMRLDTSDMAAYDSAMAEYKSVSGSAAWNKFKAKFIKMSACIIPGRTRRGAYRAWMKKHLKVRA